MLYKYACLIIVTLICGLLAIGFGLNTEIRGEGSDLPNNSAGEIDRIRLPKGDEIELKIENISGERAVMSLQNVSGESVYLNHDHFRSSHVITTVVYDLQKKNIKTGKFKSILGRDTWHFTPGHHPLPPGKTLKFEVTESAKGIFVVTVAYFVDENMYDLYQQKDKSDDDYRRFWNSFGGVSSPEFKFE